MMKEIEEFVYDATSNDVLPYKIQSFSLKKCLNRRVADEYHGTGVFVKYDRQSEDVQVTKSKKFK